jgi:soluble lytic murein transglycosylase-like protein
MERNRTAFPELKRMRSLFNSVAIVFGALALWAIPAQGQIVSYSDDNGKRVFVNAELPAIRASKSSVASTVPPGFTPRTAQPSFATATEMSTYDRANREKITEMIRETSDRYRVDPALVRAVIQTESNWNSNAVSRVGAQGLMQLVPGTAQQLGVSNAFDPKQNLDGGVRYLHSLLERYNGDLDKALAAYNAGPGAVDRAGGIPRYRETRNYVQKVTDSYYRPGSNRLPRAFGDERSIYRTVQSDGRVVFSNE